MCRRIYLERKIIYFNSIANKYKTEHQDSRTYFDININRTRLKTLAMKYIFLNSFK